ncbi:MAG: type II toxin-antitoxin system Phd/YefM family antitoxin [Streptosporangiaceae bacterium]
MSVAATPVPLSEAKARLSELARRVRLQHERITLTRNGEPEAVLLSVDDLEGLEATLEILGDSEAVARISESLAALGRGEPGRSSPRLGPAPRHWRVTTEPGQR